MVLLNQVTQQQMAELSPPLSHSHTGQKPALIPDPGQPTGEAGAPDS